MQGKSPASFVWFLIFLMVLVVSCLVATILPVKSSLSWMWTTVSVGEITKNSFNLELLLLNDMVIPRKSSNFATKIFK